MLIFVVCARMTQKMMQIFYRVSVDLGDGPSWYWAEDISIQWNSTPHMYLMLGAGIPLLMFVYLGFPAFLLWRLIGRKKKLQTNTGLYEYGYFYEGLRPEYAYWIVLVQARKATIAVISVMSSMIPLEYKINLALLTLLLAFGIHIVCNPWVDMRLNKMEEASPMTSAFLCLAQNPNANEVEKAIVLIMGAMMMLGYVFYMLYEVLAAHTGLIVDWVRFHKGYEEHSGGLFRALVAVMQIVSRSIWLQLGFMRNKGKLLYRRRSPGYSLYSCCVGVSMETPGIELNAQI